MSAATSPTTGRANGVERVCRVWAAPLLASSPFVGEGHRKVWARLRVLRGVRVSRKRVLRIMREQHLLSPHWVRRGEGLLHEGTITTEAPNLMWQPTQRRRSATITQRVIARLPRGRA